jgi:hypothetical protein
MIVCIIFYGNPITLDFIEIPNDGILYVVCGYGTDNESEHFNGEHNTGVRHQTYVQKGLTLFI